MDKGSYLGVVKSKGRKIAKAIGVDKFTGQLVVVSARMWEASWGWQLGQSLFMLLAFSEQRLVSSR